MGEDFLSFFFNCAQTNAAPEASTKTVNGLHLSLPYLRMHCVRLNGFSSVPRRDPLPPLPPRPTSETSTKWNNYHSWSLRVSTREDNRAMQRRGGGSQLPGEGNVDTIFPQRAPALGRVLQSPRSWRPRSRKVEEKRGSAGKARQETQKVDPRQRALQVDGVT